MLIQYTYAVLTMLPCPLWFYYRWLSAAFLMGVFTWSVYNGSTYYIDVFGKRFQKELEAMKAEVAKWQNSPDGMMHSPMLTPHAGTHDDESKRLGEALKGNNGDNGNGSSGSSTSSLDNIPLLTEEKGEPPVSASATGAQVDGGAKDVARARRPGAELFTAGAAPS